MEIVPSAMAAARGGGWVPAEAVLELDETKAVPRISLASERFMV